jgi:anaerobic selenocysteine-containing dehydrogenase
MGFPEPCFRDSEEEMLEQALTPDGSTTHPQMEGIALEDLRRDGHVRLRWPAEPERPFQPFADGGFGTPSGKGEFYSPGLAAAGIDPLPHFTPPAESRHGSSKYPLEFLPRKADNYMNSTFANIPLHQRLERATTNRLEMHPEDAAARKIVEGDTVEVFNDRGSIELEVLVRTSVPRGVVAGRLNWNRLSPGGRNVNALTSERLTDIGRGATFYSTLVEVRMRHFD